MAVFILYYIITDLAVLINIDHAVGPVTAGYAILRIQKTNSKRVDLVHLPCMPW